MEVVSSKWCSYVGIYSGIKQVTYKKSHGIYHNTARSLYLFYNVDCAQFCSQFRVCDYCFILHK